MSTSSSCDATSTPSPQPDLGTARITQQSDSTVMASWPHVQNGRDVVLYAVFVRENGGWAMCSWDTADV